MKQALLAEKLREKFGSGETVIGGHVFFTDPEITELLGYHGFDAIWIDAEHSAFDLNTILGHIMACASSGCASLVRVAWNDPVRIKPVLEMGPDGIILPMVCTAEEARQAVRSCTYPLKGVRGFGPRRANQYGALESGEYLENAEKSFLRILQIEHKDAIENLDEILAVEGIDIIFVGPYDLSSSLGVIGQIDHPKVMECIQEICDRAAAKGVKVGCFADNVASARRLREMGVKFIGYSCDTAVFYNAAVADVNAFQKI